MEKIYETQSIIQAVMESAVTDEALRDKLWSDPHGAMLERGVEIPSEIEIRAVSDSGETFHLILPPNPNESISDEALGSISGGAASSVFSSMATITLPDPVTYVLSLTKIY